MKDHPRNASKITGVQEKKKSKNKHLWGERTELKEKADYSKNTK